MTTTIKLDGSAGNLLAARLQAVLTRSVQEIRRSAPEACKHAVIVMAGSAAKATPKGKALRPARDNPLFRHLLRKSQYKKLGQAGKDLRPYFKLTGFKLRQPPNQPKSLYANQRRAITKIRRVGTAKSSWAWGLRKLNKAAAAQQREIPGVTTVENWMHGNLQNGGSAGTLMDNRLSYVEKIMGSGWHDRVLAASLNLIEKNMELTLLKRAKRAMERAAA